MAIHLEWSESVQPISQVDQYRIYRNVDGGVFSLLATLDIERDMFGGRITELEYDDETALVGHFYGYYVIGHPVQGPDSAPSNIVYLTNGDFRITEDGIARELEESTEIRVVE